MKLSSFFQLINRAYNDIVNPNRFGVTDSFLKNPAFPYSLDYTTIGMEEYYDMEFDENGIILMSHYYDHLEKYGNEEKHYHSPVKIAHYALAAYNDYLKTGDAAFERKFKIHLEYLVNSAEKYKNGIVWKTPTSNPKYGLAPGYISAIVQGLVISALVRGSLHFGIEAYFKLAEDALLILEVPVEEGGLLANAKWGKIYEEYPCIPYSHVVNGHIFCLIGLFDLYHITESRKAKLLFDDGIDSLKIMIPDWLTDDWASYDLRHLTGDYKRNLATRHYQYLHIDQLDILYKMTSLKWILRTEFDIDNQLKSRTKSIKLYFKKFGYLKSKI